MARLHLTVLANGKCIITTEGRLTADEQKVIEAMVEQWLEGKSPLLLLDDCDVVRVEVPR